MPQLLKQQIRLRMTLLAQQPGQPEREVSTLAEAQVLRMICPICYQRNMSPSGLDTVEVVFAENQIEGTNLDDLTIIPSVVGCHRHPGYFAHFVKGECLINDHKEPPP